MPSLERVALRELCWIAKEVHGWLISTDIPSGLLRRYDNAIDLAEGALAICGEPLAVSGWRCNLGAGHQGDCAFVGEMNSGT